VIGPNAYSDPTKDTWRGWKWNAIAEKLCGKRCSPSARADILQRKTVLYLCGPDDCDRRKLLALGFANHNCFAVDIFKPRIAEIRDKGGFGMCSSMQALLFAWPVDFRLDVIDCDLCSGLVADVFDLALAFSSCAGVRGATIFSGNFMRGRDADSHSLRAAIGDGIGSDGAVKRSRAWLGLMALRDPAQLYFDRGEVVRDSIDYSTFRQLRTESVIGEYRSKTSGQWFDSVIHEARFTTFAKGIIREHESLEKDVQAVSKELTDVDDSVLGKRKKTILSRVLAAYREMSELNTDVQVSGKGMAASGLSRKCCDKKASRKIAALRAMRTMALARLTDGS
jgi:hypothetical protein